MYYDSKGILAPATASNDPITFSADKGVKQGDGASPELFILFFDRVYAYL